MWVSAAVSVCLCLCVTVCDSVCLCATHVTDIQETRLRLSVSIGQATTRIQVMAQLLNMIIPNLYY